MGGSIPPYPSDRQKLCTTQYANTTIAPNAMLIDGPSRLLRLTAMPMPMMHTIIDKTGYANLACSST
jgi:hypothetical protein